MQKTLTHLPALYLAGIQTRTNLQTETTPALAKISPTVQRYFGEGIAAQLTERRTPGVTYCVYTDYESDYTGDYTYFIGEVVPDFKDLPLGLAHHAVPAQSYVKFTTLPGPMPQVLIAAWMAIWEMTEAQLGGKRRYLSDFEVYDQRAADPTNTVVDIYVGIDPT